MEEMEDYELKCKSCGVIYRDGEHNTQMCASLKLYQGKNVRYVFADGSHEEDGV